MNKNTLIALGGFLALSFTSHAQEHHHGPNYETSIYFGLETQTAINEEYKSITEAAISQHFPDWSYSLDPKTGIFTHIYGPAREVKGGSMDTKAKRLIP